MKCIRVFEVFFRYYGICTAISTCTTFITYGLIAFSGTGAFSSGGSGLLGWLGSRESVAPSAGRTVRCVRVPVLAPDDSSSLPERPSRGEQRSCVVSSLRDVSREGPFAVSDTPSDTGVLPLVTNMLQGCPYRMTSYEPMSLADMDPVYGLQLTHPGSLNSSALRSRHVC